MGKFFRAIFVTTLATSAAVLVVAAFRKAAREVDEGVSSEAQPQPPEVEADKLPADLRNELVAELEGHV